MSGAICGGYDYEVRRVMFCPTEGKRRRMVAQFAHWYGFTYTCLGCGDRWQDGERGERPFARAWRKDAIARAQKVWDRVTIDSRHAKAAFRDVLDAYFAGDR